MINNTNNTAIANPIAVLKDTKGIAQNIKNTFVPARQIVFIDSQVEDYQLLANLVSSGGIFVRNRIGSPKDVRMYSVTQSYLIALLLSICAIDTNQYPFPKELIPR